MGGAACKEDWAESAPARLRSAGASKV